MSDSKALDPEAARAARSHFASRAIIYALLALFSAVYLVPLLVVVLNTFRDNVEVGRNGLIAFPRSFTLEAWPKAWGSYCLNGRCEGMSANFWNSVYMTIPATAISTMLGALNGYILSKWK